ncbi:mammaglobin-B-like [Otolemur garnettii]|uniref:mammaglobin-B-like n=1 Tax=Otolemur garnettii TaxID=30611 RepID=UPI000151492F|nr:mammaglobin-B-like [Otolemur garnettii]
MKLLTVFLLAALPFCCSAGSGCQLLEDLVKKTLDLDVSVPDYKNAMQDFTDGEKDKNAVEEFKQCFLSQSKETLTNFGNMMQIMYNSKFCFNF